MKILLLPSFTSLLLGEYPESELFVNSQMNLIAISSHPPLQSSTQLSTLNYLGFTLAAISHHHSSLLFTA
jgi:hypothetical protein